MQFRILKSFGSERLEWTNLIGKLKPEEQDIHFLPEYGNIYQQAYGYEPFLAFYGDENHYLIQVFVKRPLNELAFLKDQKITESFFDIANPYGFGGPLCRCNSITEGRQLFIEFDSYLKDYCCQNKIASEFTCLHPLLGNHQYLDNSGVIVQYEKEVVYLDLAKSEKELWMELRHGHKYSINKARKLNVRIEKMPLHPVNFETFEKLYLQTMIRNNAAGRWFFPANYFRNYVLMLGPSRVSLFFAFIDEAPVAAFLLMHDLTTVYYQFSGSDNNFHSSNANTLLMFEVSLWAQKKGFLRYHLGGGVTSSPEDSLFRYKAGFSRQHAGLYSYHRIHNQAVYDYLCALKKQHETMEGAKNNSDYFPLYRR